MKQKKEKALTPTQHAAVLKIARAGGSLAIYEHRQRTHWGYNSPRQKPKHQWYAWGIRADTLTVLLKRQVVQVIKRDNNDYVQLSDKQRILEARTQQFVEDRRFQFEKKWNDRIWRVAVRLDALYDKIMEPIESVPSGWELRQCNTSKEFAQLKLRPIPIRPLQQAEKKYHKLWAYMKQQIHAKECAIANYKDPSPKVVTAALIAETLTES